MSMSESIEQWDKGSEDVTWELIRRLETACDEERREIHEELERRSHENN